MVLVCGSQPNVFCFFLLVKKTIGISFILMFVVWCVFYSSEEGREKTSWEISVAEIITFTICEHWRLSEAAVANSSFVLAHTGGISFVSSNPVNLGNNNGKTNNMKTKTNCRRSWRKISRCTTTNFGMWTVELKREKRKLFTFNFLSSISTTQEKNCTQSKHNQQLTHPQTFSYHFSSVIANTYLKD